MTDVREFPLGFGPTTIAPGATVDIAARPQVGFTGKRLVVVKGYDHAKIEGIKAGGRSQLAGQPIPAAAFAPTALGVRMDMNGVEPGQEIVLTVSSDKGGVFQAALLGEAGGALVEPMEPLVEEAIKMVKEAEEAYEPGVTLDEATGELRGDE